MRLRLGMAVIGLTLLAGCSQLDGMATRFRVERMLFEAQRTETRLRIGKAAPDSATLLRIYFEYRKPRLNFRAPYFAGSGAGAEKIRRDITRQIGLAELAASRTALQAHRPDLAIESARWVVTVAGTDTVLAREGYVAMVFTLRALRAFDEAIITMRAMLERFPPAEPRSPDQEDPILNIPDAIIELRGETADSSMVGQDRAYAVAYYRRLLAAHPSPFLESQVRARLSRTLLEAGDANAAFAEVSTLRALVQRTPGLRSLEPEILYTEGRIRGMQKDFKSALSIYDGIAKTHPASPFAARALLDAAVIAERVGKPGDAIARYRAILDRPNPDPAIASVASYRMAMVMDQIGRWEDAKQVLEGIPTQYPRSRAGVEAPFAIVEHYNRARQPDAAKAALAKAIDTYRVLIRQDTVSAYATVYRWNTLRAQAALGRAKDALSTVDQMAENDRGAPITSEALFQGAQIALGIGDKVKSDVYLQRIVMEYPRSPRAAGIRKYLSEHAGNSRRP